MRDVAVYLVLQQVHIFAYYNIFLDTRTPIPVPVTIGQVPVKFYIKDGATDLVED